MTGQILLAAVAVAALAAAACKGNDAGDDPSAEGSAAIVETAARPDPVATPAAVGDDALSAADEAILDEVMAVREEMAAAAEKHTSSCDQAARAVEAIVARNRERLAASAALESDPARRRSIGERYGARMLASSSKLMALIERCDEHEGLLRLFESLD
jgi:hypothetical protein